MNKTKQKKDHATSQKHDLYAPMILMSESFNSGD